MEESSLHQLTRVVGSSLRGSSRSQEDGFYQKALDRDHNFYFRTKIDICGGEYAVLWAEIELIFATSCGSIVG